VQPLYVYNIYRSRTPAQLQATQLQDPNRRRSKQYGIADSGASDTYMRQCDHHLDKQIAKNPISVEAAGCKSMQSTHTCRWDAPNLPPAATTGYILPDLNSHSLVSLGKLCDNDCTVILKKGGIYINHHDQRIMEGPRDPATRPWHLPLAPAAAIAHTCHTAWLAPAAPPPGPPTAKALTCPIPCLCPTRTAQYELFAHRTSNQQDLMRYLHAACGSPVPSTWIASIRNNQFATWPGLSTRAVQRHLPASMATAMGHPDRRRKNQRSTKPITSEPSPEPTDSTTSQFPAQEPKRCHAVFAALGLADLHNHVVYIDLTGGFPVTSQAGNKYMLILYDYNGNAILVEPMKSWNDVEALRAYDKLYTILTNRGLTPMLNILNNESSTAHKRQIHKSGAQHQLVVPYDHRVNAAERAIRTWKNHFIACLCSTDPRFPVVLSDRLIPQAVITLNLLRTSRINPQLSAHAQLYGMFDFNKTPLAPPGTRALIFEDPDTREIWAPHGKEAWYLGPAMEHYRCYEFYLPETKGTRIAGSVEFFTHYCNTPTISSAEQATHAAQDLMHALANPTPATPFRPLSPPHLKALRN
jgi:hypothetical protein